MYVLSYGYMGIGTALSIIVSADHTGYFLLIQTTGK